MKKTSLILITLVMLLTLCACGQKAPTWQEQYDLGMRYLSDGNYEEAIIAFEAAIEIDPKQADAYVNLVEAYRGTGDFEAVQRVMAALYEQLGQEAAEQRLHELGLNVWGTKEFTMRYGYVPYEELPARRQELVKTAVEHILAGDSAYLQTMLENYAEGDDDRELYTMCEGYKVFFRMDSYDSGISSGNTTNGSHIEICVEIRPENGMGYYVYADKEVGQKADGQGNYGPYNETYISPAQCNCTDWQWSGEMRETTRWIIHEEMTDYISDFDRTDVETGQFVNGLRTGEFVTKSMHVNNVYTKGTGEFSPSSYEDTEVNVYENGFLISRDGEPWNDRDGGAVYSMQGYGMIGMWDTIYW